MKVMINPLTVCNSNCPYCWVTESGVLRKQPVYDYRRWLGAIEYLNYISPVSIVDVCGGEPTMWDELYAFCAMSQRPVAVTSNMLNKEYLRFLNRPCPNLVSWTASFHPSNGQTAETFAAKVAAMASVTSVVIAVLEKAQGCVEHVKFFRSLGFNTVIEPYEKIPGLAEMSLDCDGGCEFLFIDPDGHAYPCVDSYRATDRTHRRLGNVFYKSVKLRTQRGCRLDCNAANVHIPKHPSGDCHGLNPLVGGEK